ncbi:hypothetical protein AYI69_g1967 [Smittium culicis]|uniref:Uncharacterized protein n=1 Tax=Smittium culicis TaxID=133412 RepID=A0A1R1YNS9_9FUNG|nr:hypothetical protein AYI69_g1967 [Smittium culicis]
MKIFFLYTLTFILVSFVASQQDLSEDNGATSDLAKAAESVVKGKNIESITYKDMLDIFGLVSSSDNENFAINLNSVKRNLDPVLNRYNRRGVRSEKIKGFNGASNGEILGSTSKAKNKNFLRKLSNRFKKRYQSSKIKVPGYIKSSFSVLKPPKPKPRVYKMMESMKPRAELKVPDIKHLYNMKRKIQTSSIRISSSRAKRSSKSKQNPRKTKEYRLVGSMKRSVDAKSPETVDLKNMKRKPHAPTPKSYRNYESMTRKSDTKPPTSTVLKNMQKKPKIFLFEPRRARTHKRISNRSNPQISIAKDNRKISSMKKRAGGKNSSTAILMNMKKQPQTKVTKPKLPNPTRKRSTEPKSIRAMKKRAGSKRSSTVILKNMIKRPQAKESNKKISGGGLNQAIMPSAYKPIETMKKRAGGKAISKTNLKNMQ